METENARWMIIVAVCLDGTEVRVSIEPNETIGLLLSRVTAICGKDGTLFNSMGELRLTDTGRESGLSDQAAVHLQIEDFFAAEKAILIAFRDHFNIQKTGWGSLEEFAKPEEFAKCLSYYGSQCLGGVRVIDLNLRYGGLGDEKVGQCKYCPLSKCSTLWLAQVKFRKNWEAWRHSSYWHLITINYTVMNES
jgi:hypothetical protein